MRVVNVRAATPSACDAGTAAAGPHRGDQLAGLAAMATSPTHGNVRAPVASGRVAAADESAHDPIASPVLAYLESLHARFRDVHDGAVADYIPELSKARPEWFGICVATTDGRVYEVGDSRQAFTIQSISKPLTYGLALEDNGHAAVLDKIGVEPTGDAFNSISLAPDTGRPLNPMINAGAIAATSLVAGHSQQDRLQRLLAVYGLYAGRPLAIDERVYTSERGTGHRNRAIGHMLRNFGILEGDPEPALDLYFRQCSIEIECRDLAVIGATLANGGINPLTNERALRPEYVESVLSVMTTCGMYDFAGEWAYSVGLPAKSGVGGGVLAVLPGQLGIGVFSPLLDARGNSVRGVGVCRELSRDFNLHFLHVARPSRSILRAEYSAARVSSKRRRSEDDRRTLDHLGQRACIYELQGDLGFSALETVVHRLVSASPSMDFAIVDLKRVSLIEPTAMRVLVELIRSFAQRGKTIVFVDGQHEARVVRRLREHAGTPELREAWLSFADLDPALEHCENALLATARPAPEVDRDVALADHSLCRGLSASEVAVLAGLVEERTYAAGQVIVQRGRSADEIFFLLRGEVSVMIDLANGQQKRLSTMSAGMAFGEMAAVSRAVRSADVRADVSVRCLVLSTDAFERLAQTHPGIRITLLENLLRNLAAMVSRLNQEVATLAE
jgi:glutaminase